MAQAAKSDDESKKTAAKPRKRGRPAKGAEPPPFILKPGAILTREWRGRIERVMALEDGLAWNGKSYLSLSAVAFAITGVKWSGQRFFFGAKGRDGASEESRAKSLQRAKRGGSHQPPRQEAAL